MVCQLDTGLPLTCNAAEHAVPSLDCQEQQSTLHWLASWPAMVSAPRHLHLCPVQAVIPRTSRMDRMQENLDLFSFDLSDQDMLALDALDGSPQQVSGSGSGSSSGGSGGGSGSSSSGSGGGSGSSSGSGSGGREGTAAGLERGGAGRHQAHDEQRRAALAS